MFKKNIDKTKIENQDLEILQEEINDYDELWDEWYFDDMILEELDTTAVGCCNLVNNFFICI